MKVITTGLLNRFWTKGIKPWLDKRIKSYADLMVTTASGYTPDALAVKEGFTELTGKLGNNIGYPDLKSIEYIIRGNGTYTIKQNGYIRVYYSGTPGSVQVNGVPYIYSGTTIEMTFPPMLVKAGDVVKAVNFKDANSSVGFCPFI